MENNPDPNSFLGGKWACSFLAAKIGFKHLLLGINRSNCEQLEEYDARLCWVSAKF